MCELLSGSVNEPLSSWSLEKRTGQRGVIRLLRLISCCVGGNCLRLELRPIWCCASEELYDWCRLESQMARRCCQWQATCITISSRANPPTRPIYHCWQISVPPVETIIRVQLLFYDWKQLASSVDCKSHLACYY